MALLFGQIWRRQMDQKSMEAEIANVTIAPWRFNKGFYQRFIMNWLFKRQGTHIIGIAIASTTNRIVSMIDLHIFQSRANVWIWFVSRMKIYSILKINNVTQWIRLGRLATAQCDRNHISIQNMTTMFSSERWNNSIKTVRICLWLFAWN
jgi:hypothetical protein